MICKTKGATFTLYFAEGDTYTADFRSKREAERRGYQLASDHRKTFTCAEEIKPCDFYYEA